MPLLMAIIAAVGGIAFWRRKTIRDDAQRINDAARSRVQTHRSDRKKLLTELGQHYYANSTNGDDVDHLAEMTRLVDQLIEIDSESADEDIDVTSAEEDGDVTDKAATSE